LNVVCDAFVDNFISTINDFIWLVSAKNICGMNQPVLPAVASEVNDMAVGLG
jgi:hypothetical protein